MSSGRPPTAAHIGSPHPSRRDCSFAWPTPTTMREPGCATRAPCPSLKAEPSPQDSRGTSHLETAQEHPAHAFPELCNDATSRTEPERFWDGCAAPRPCSRNLATRPESARAQKPSPIPSEHTACAPLRSLRPQIRPPPMRAFYFCASSSSSSSLQASFSFSCGPTGMQFPLNSQLYSSQKPDNGDTTMKGVLLICLHNFRLQPLTGSVHLWQQEVAETLPFMPRLKGVTQRKSLAWQQEEVQKALGYSFLRCVLSLILLLLSETCIMMVVHCLDQRGLSINLIATTMKAKSCVGVEEGKD
ncbi:uncharacterized protein LOC143828985 isoform X2 [Paroedura picta]|uniref:uncharacterized protein LOC143828985 isoform X2 n=1 Tax=Paroedura picta TaxID=143630 RepID=UPI004055BE2E